jgi:hypothetical protein
MIRTAIVLAWTMTMVGCTDPTAEDVGIVSQATICGPTNDAQHVNHYKGAAGPSVEFVWAHKDSKGAMDSQNTGADSKYCSGTLIADDLFLTAGHCVDGSTVGDYVSFNYERGVNTKILRPEVFHRISAVLEDGRGGLDYAIVRVEGNPGQRFGFATVAADDPPPGAQVTIIGHPDGTPKMIAAGTVSSVGGDYIEYANVDTLGGSSGSGIIDAQGRVVGVHTLGGCTPTGGTNSGPRISLIRAASSIL